jgi:hypothetical protein
MSVREILLTGSVPITPASKVFELVSDCCGDAMARMPDGEQAGWVESLRRAIGENEALEPSQTSRIGRESRFSRPVQLYKLREGRRAADIELGDLGVAANALSSYEQFRKLREQGRIRPGTRLQVTIAGPATTGGMLDLPEEDVYAIVEPALKREIAKVIESIPAEDLAIQIDLAVEVEKEEFRRRPEAFDTPLFAIRRFTFDGSVAAAARIAMTVPPQVELGFHLCAMWHIYKDAGQDLNVQVDYANALSKSITRSIAYMHLPTTPEYGVADFLPLKRLTLHAETKLFIGLIHAIDGATGATRRIRAAQQVLPNFGIAHFCGLGQWGSGPETVEPMLKLHRELAAV